MEGMEEETKIGVNVRELHPKDLTRFSVCPFMSANQLVWNSTYNGCIKEKCALWSYRKKSCSLKVK